MRSQVQGTGTCQNSLPSERKLSVAQMDIAQTVVLPITFKAGSDLRKGRPISVMQLLDLAHSNLKG